MKSKSFRINGNITIDLHKIVGSSDKCVPGCMKSQDFKFEKLKVSIAIGLTFKGFDFIIQTF